MEIKNAKDIKSIYGTYLIYGIPGMGKTTSLKFLPGKTLVLDIDRTSNVLKGCENIDIVEVDNIDTWGAWEALVVDLTTTYKGKYQNVCIDNISELERCLLSSLGKKGKNNGVPSQGNYQEYQFRLVNSIRYLKTLECNVIITAWETTDLYTTAEGQQFNRSFPQLNGKILNNIMGICNCVGRLMINKDGKRGFVLTPTNSIYAKNQIDTRSGCLQEDLILREGEEVERES